MTCKARRMNDQMMCGRCGIQWDYKEEKPECVDVGYLKFKEVKEGLQTEDEKRQKQKN